MFKLLIWIVGVFIVAYIAGRPLYWHLNETLNATSYPCPPCHCDCSLQPLLTLPEGIYLFLIHFFTIKLPYSF